MLRFYVYIFTRIVANHHEEFGITQPIITVHLQKVMSINQGQPTQLHFNYVSIININGRDQSLCELKDSYTWFANGITEGKAPNFQ